MARPAENLFHKAELAIKRRNFDYAIELLLQGLKLDPLNVEQRRRLRQTEILAIQSKGGNTKGDLLKSVTSLGTQWRIKKLGVQKKWEEQILEIENFLRNAPQSTGALYQLAHAFRNLEGGHDAAVAALQEIVEVDRTQIEAWRQLGTLHAGSDPEKAIRCWEKVKQYRPEDKEAGKAIRDLSAATMVKRAEDRKKGGEGDFRDLLADEDEARKLQEEQQIIRTDDDARRAIQRVKEKLADAPEEKRLIRQLGDLHRRLKEYRAAEEQYKKLLEMDPNDLYAKERIGDLQEHIHNDHVAELEEKLKAAPDDEALKEQLKKALDDRDTFLLGELQRRVAAHPTDAGLKAKFGGILLKKGRLDEAIEQFQKALVDPRLATQAHGNLGRCFKAKGLYDLAVEEFKKTLGQLPDKNSALGKDFTYSLGETYALKEDWAEALATMQTILAVDIRFRDVSQKVMEYQKKLTEASK
jgi:tetratricopeptide (TPR) repeat protein